MTAFPVRHRAALAGGLALAAVAATASVATAAEPDPTGPYNRQVALHNDTAAQHPWASSLSGTGQVSSRNGALVVFSTTAPLVEWDDNDDEDVYLRSDSVTVLVSSKDGVPGNGMSLEPTISDDGRYVAYATMSTNLAKGTKGGGLDVVVRDLQGDRTTLVSSDRAGRRGDRNDFAPVISGNGRHIAFQSFSRLGPKDQDRTEDVYVRDLRRDRTRQASLLPGGSKDVPGYLLNGDISRDGRLVTFGNDTRLWVRDLVKGRTTLVHREPPSAPCNLFEAGSAGRPNLSGNGRYVVWSTCAAALVGDSGIAQVFRLDLRSRELEQLTDGNAHSYHTSLSHDGRYLAFGSDASDLVEGDDEGMPDAFRLDTVTGEVLRASQAPDGVGGNSYSATNDLAISADGRSLFYVSYADNLVPGDEYDEREALAWSDHRILD